jgi:hypothetical protein
MDSQACLPPSRAVNSLLAHGWCQSTRQRQESCGSELRVRTVRERRATTPERSERQGELWLYGEALVSASPQRLILQVV